MNTIFNFQYSSISFGSFNRFFGSFFLLIFNRKQKTCSVHHELVVDNLRANHSNCVPGKEFEVRLFFRFQVPFRTIHTFTIELSIRTLFGFEHRYYSLLCFFFNSILLTIFRIVFESTLLIRIFFFEFHIFCNRELLSIKNNADGWCL